MQLNRVGLESQLISKTKFANQNGSTSTSRQLNSQNKHEEELINSKEVKTVVSKLNGFIDPVRTNLQFKYHEELNEYYVTVVNPLTNEVVKEIVKL